MNITTAELLDALANAQNASEEMPPNTFSGPQIRTAMGLGHEKFSVMMRGLIANGEAQLVKVRRQAVDGRMARVVAYQILAPTKKRK